MILKDESPFESMSWVDRLAKLRQNMVVLHQCRHEDDGRYRFLVPVEKVPAEIPVQTASIVPDFSNAEGPKVTADCFFLGSLIMITIIVLVWLLVLSNLGCLNQMVVRWMPCNRCDD